MTIHAQPISKKPKKIRAKKNHILGHTYIVWLKLQKGQEKILRFAKHRKEFREQIRAQNGHEHCVSVNHLATETMIRMRRYGALLDELILTRAWELHDKSEGILGYEVIAPNKKDEDDLREYLAFERVYKKLGKRVWPEYQRCFLLQFALKNPSCFPQEARDVMADLARRYRNEALFFQGVQYVDYLFYAYECFREYGICEVIEDITRNSFVHIDAISSELIGFDKVLWTPRRRKYFAQFLKPAPQTSSGS